MEREETRSGSEIPQGRDLVARRNDAGVRMTGSYGTSTIVDHPAVS